MTKIGVHTRRWLSAVAVLHVAAATASNAVFATLRHPPANAAAPGGSPVPHPVWSRSPPLTRAHTELVKFETAPFPYNGNVPGEVKSFLEVDDAGRRVHRSTRGQVYWEDQTFNDPRVLLHIPEGFDARRPSLMIVFFHGHRATIDRDVRDRQRVPAQISASGLNAVLVAPQFAVNAPNSSAGRFWEPGGFGRFLGEAAQQLGRMHGDPRTVRTFAGMPVVIVAYSGGYLPTAWSLVRGGLEKRLRGVVLLDALYGQLDTFAGWIKSDRSAFFVSSYTNSTRGRNMELQRILAKREIAFSTSLQGNLRRGSVTFLATADARHNDFVTHAWVDSPIEDLLKRINGYHR
jgi:hypothetical protein